MKRIYVLDVSQEEIDKHHSDLSDGEFVELSKKQEQYFRDRRLKGLTLEEFIEAFNDGYINSETDVIRLI